MVLAGIIGIGEESTYLILSASGLAAPGWHQTDPGICLWRIIEPQQKTQSQKPNNGDWLTSNSVKVKKKQIRWQVHELPDKFRHKLHHFRYHQLGKLSWIFFGVAFLFEIILQLLERFNWIDASLLEAMGIPFVSWLCMVGVFIIVIYRLLIRMTTHEFGKIFENEFEDTGDAVGDLAETCSSVILLIFLLTFAVQTIISLIGMDRLTFAVFRSWPSGRADRRLNRPCTGNRGLPGLYRSVLCTGWQSRANAVRSAGCLLNSTDR
ncbi:MAG: hypothetical protein MZW92_36565 [Comamonadaceae bacterium]|nr:hypothetical protein [Comamonadaceae bacterium]